MAPEWLRPDATLSSDADLRRLQLRWLTDELWMRRIVLGVAIVLPSGGVAALLVAPSAHTLVGACAGSVAGPPLAYFFGRPGRSTEPPASSESRPQVVA
jgi:hypothetical protein